MRPIVTPVEHAAVRTMPSNIMRVTLFSSNVRRGRKRGGWDGMFIEQSSKLVLLNVIHFGLRNLLRFATCIIAKFISRNFILSLLA